MPSFAASLEKKHLRDERETPNGSGVIEGTKEHGQAPI
jgi:hypothetical protein